MLNYQKKNKKKTWHYLDSYSKTMVLHGMTLQISDQQQVMLNLWTCVLFVALLQWGDGVKHFHWLRWTAFKPDRQQMGGLYTLNNEFPDQEKIKEHSELRLQGRV